MPSAFEQMPTAEEEVEECQDCGCLCDSCNKGRCEDGCEECEC